MLFLLASTVCCFTFWPSMLKMATLYSWSRFDNEMVSFAGFGKMETLSKASFSFIPTVTQGAGAVPVLVSVSVQAPSAEKVAVRLIGPPSDGKVTPTKVCGEVKPDTETVAVPSPVKFKLPVVGEFTKVTVTSAVKKSSLPSPGVPLSSQGEMFAVSIAEIAQAFGSQIYTGKV